MENSGSNSSNVMSKIPLIMASIHGPFFLRNTILLPAGIRNSNAAVNGFQSDLSNDHKTGSNDSFSGL